MEIALKEWLAYLCQQAVAKMKATWFNLYGSATFNDLEGFRRARPPEKYLSSDKYKTHALWWSGRGILPRIEEHGCNICTLILQDPRNGELIERMESTWTDLQLGTKHRILETTENALKLGVDVFWCWDWPGEALTFQNPQSHCGTLAVEKISSYRGVGDRPIEFYRRNRNTDLYEREWGRFRRLTKESEPITADMLPALRDKVFPTELDVRVDSDIWTHEYWDPSGRRYVILRPVQVASRNDAEVAVKARLKLTHLYGKTEVELEPREDPPNGYEPRKEWLGRIFTLDPKPDHIIGELGYHIPLIDQDFMGITEPSQGVQGFRCELHVEDISSGTTTIVETDRPAVLNREDVRP